MRRLFLACSLCFLAACFIACGTGTGVGERPGELPHVTSAVIEPVIRDFMDDSEAARRKYQGAELTASGVVHSADRNPRTGGVAFVLGSVAGNNVVMGSAAPSARESILALKQGNKVTVKGRIVSGVRMKDGVVSVALDDIELAH
jgi:hypothetical protein